MLTIRRSSERGHFDHGWLNSYHTFSFGEYHDPQHMRFRSLRVINEDFVAPGQGFGMHPHRDMEIITWIVSGALQHRDSMGNGEVIRPGDIQHMTAGTGVLHSEFNPSKDEPVHLLQIWIMPAQRDLPPNYAQVHVPAAERTNRLRLVARGAGAGARAPAMANLAAADSTDGGHDHERENAAVRIEQDAHMYATLLEPGHRVSHALERDRHAWVQVIRGPIEVNGQRLESGDGAAISGEPAVGLASPKNATAEALLFDLA